jgi:lipopolysaccharide export system ATP-binding protein
MAARGPGQATGSRLEARGLQKTYGSRKVVKDVSLGVDKGEVVGLLGPNGAGKTTSFYMIVGLVRADAGEISIDGVPIAHMPIHRRSRMGLSYLPQEASIFRKLTVEENVRAVLELQREPNGDGRPVPLSKQRIEERLSELLHDLRVDPIAVIEIQRIINFLKERGIGVLITDHNVRETLGICDHAFIISDGHVLAQGTPSEIVDNAEVRRVYLGEHFRM